MANGNLHLPDRPRLTRMALADRSRLSPAHAADGMRGARILRRCNQAWRSARALASLHCY